MLTHVWLVVYVLITTTIMVISHLQYMPMKSKGTHTPICTPFSSSSTSSSNIFSPSCVSMYHNYPVLMNPFPSLSNTWKPWINSSEQCQYQEGWENARATKVCLCTWCASRLEPIRSVQDGQKSLIVDYVHPLVRGYTKWTLCWNLCSLGADMTISATSTCVGFCFSALKKSPNVSWGTPPVPFLLKSMNASLYSVAPSINKWTGHLGVLTHVIALHWWLI